MRSSAILLALASSPIVFAASSQPTCGSGSNCPSSSPCCGAYGQCGVGAYCLGGCYPRYSYNLQSCVPAPICQTEDFKLTSTNDIADIAAYLGDPSKANWVASGVPVGYNNQAVLLTMAEGTVGTLLSSVNYVWYGTISATLTTSQGAGVVTAFILMSDSHDEIDYEFVGVDVQHGQTNFYAQGITNYNNEVNVTASNTATETHVYTIDWTPDTLTWYVDGVSMRVKNRADTWNSTGNRYDYPQTPSRVQLSLWPAGLASNGQGTVEWSGGAVDWNSPYMKNGYYYAMISDVNVKCAGPPPGANVAGSKSYVYTDTASTNQSIKITDDIVILSSLFATGNNPTYGASSSQSSNAPETVPGVSGIGTRGDLPGGSNNPASGSGINSTTFSQGGNGKSAGYSVHERLSTGGSAFAVLIAIICVCFWL